MSMKELKISELMDEYTDNEFCIEWETCVDNDELKQLVLAQARPKRRVKPLFKGLIAAAAAVCLAGGAVVGSDFLKGSFTTGSGMFFEYEVMDDSENIGFSWHAKLNVSALTKEDDRLYLNIGGESTEITDLIDHDMPYIYTYTDPQNALPAYVIAGGTADGYGYADMFYVDGIGWVCIGSLYDGNGDGTGDLNVRIEYYLSDQTTITDGDIKSETGALNEQIVDIMYMFSGSHHEHYGRRDENGDYEGLIADSDEPVFSDTWRDDCPEAWLLSALEQLGFVKLPE